MKRNANRKHIAELLRLLPAGSRIETRSRPGETGSPRSSHPIVFLPDGEPLRGNGGVPIRVSGTPSDRRSFLNDRAAIRRALRDAGIGEP